MNSSGTTQDAYTGGSDLCFDRPAMLRKVLWTALTGALGAIAAIVTRRSAAAIWRTVTGEEPPTKQ